MISCPFIDVICHPRVTRVMNRPNGGRIIFGVSFSLVIIFIPTCN